MQVTHARSLHTSGRGQQQQEAVAVESEPVPLSVFRTQENDPVSRSDFSRACVVIMLTGNGETHSTVILKYSAAFEYLYDFRFQAHCLSLF